MDWNAVYKKFGVEAREALVEKDRKFKGKDLSLFEMVDEEDLKKVVHVIMLLSVMQTMREDDPINPVIDNMTYNLKSFAIATSNLKGWI